MKAFFPIETRIGKGAAGAALLILLLVLGAACKNPFAPELTHSLDVSGFIVTDQQSPEEVLQNFKVAYTFRDSLLYSDLLDTAFVFVYFDPEEGTSGRYVSWGRETDLTTTGRLFRHFHLIDLVWNSTLYAWADEDQGEMGKAFHLTLSGESGDYTVSGKAVFSFRRGLDGRWRIMRWKDESSL